jgi:hypothetical protein
MSKDFQKFSFRCTRGEEGDQVAVFPSSKAEQRLRTKMREMMPPNRGRSVTSCMESVSRYLTGWISHFRLCTPDAVQGLGVLDAHIRRRVRTIIVRQKKRPLWAFPPNTCSLCSTGVKQDKLRLDGAVLPIRSPQAASLRSEKRHKNSSLRRGKICERCRHHGAARLRRRPVVFPPTPQNPEADRQA